MLRQFLLPSANEVCERYVFTPVYQSFCSGGRVSASVHAGADTPQEQTTPGSRHPPEADTPHPEADMGNKRDVSILMEWIHVISGSQVRSGAEYACPFLCPFVILIFL